MKQMNERNPHRAPNCFGDIRELGVPELCQWDADLIDRAVAPAYWEENQFHLSVKVPALIWRALDQGYWEGDPQVACKALGIPPSSLRRGSPLWEERVDILGRRIKLMRYIPSLFTRDFRPSPVGQGEGKLFERAVARLASIEKQVSGLQKGWKGLEVQKNLLASLFHTWMVRKGRCEAMDLNRGTMVLAVVDHEIPLDAGRGTQEVLLTPPILRRIEGVDDPWCEDVLPPPVPLDLDDQWYSREDSSFLVSHTTWEIHPEDDSPWAKELKAIFGERPFLTFEEVNPWHKLWPKGIVAPSMGGEAFLQRGVRKVLRAASEEDKLRGHTLSRVLLMESKKLGLTLDPLWGPVEDTFEGVSCGLREESQGVWRNPLWEVRYSPLARKGDTTANVEMLPVTLSVSQWPPELVSGVKRHMVASKTHIGDMMAILDMEDASRHQRIRAFLALKVATPVNQCLLRLEKAA
jgi:hypothetical protein